MGKNESVFEGSICCDEYYPVLTILQVSWLNAAVLRAVVDHGVDGLDVLVVEYVAMVVDDGAPGQHAVLAVLAPPAHHLTVHSNTAPRSGETWCNIRTF